jgi:hypothetical protein
VFPIVKETSAISRAACTRVSGVDKSSEPALYERHGFEVIGEIRVGSCPPIVPMLREAGAPK